MYSLQVLLALVQRPQSNFCRSFNGRLNVFEGGDWYEQVQVDPPNQYDK